MSTILEHNNGADDPELIDPNSREALLAEARGEEPVEEAPEPEPEPEPEPTEVDLLRAQMLESQRKMDQRFQEEKERRRRITRRAEALERQVQELVGQQQSAAQPTHVKLEYDADGTPILPVSALRQITAPPAPRASAAQPDSEDSPAAAYQRTRASLIAQDPAYEPIFTRLETLAREVVVGLREATRDGEMLRSTDDVIDYLDNSDFGATLKERYPEIPDWESVVPAIDSARSARKLAERVYKARSSDPAPTPKTPVTPKASAAPTQDLTSAARARMKERAVPIRSRTPVGDGGIALEDAAKLTPEELLDMPAAKRASIQAALRKTFQQPAR